MEMSSSHLVESVKSLCYYIEDYLPLANAHVADFIIEDYWTNYVPESIAQELMQLSDADLAKLPSYSIYHGDGLLDDELESCRLSSSSAVPEQPWEDKKERESWDLSKIPVWKHEKLSDFVREAKRNSLPSMQVLTDLDLLKKKWKVKTGEKVVIHQFMTAKKSHEVDIMAEVCSSLADYINTSTVIDVGSGRGYLSSHLNLMYGLSVLAVDSSHVNTNSAQTRGQRLQKHWAGIVRNAKATAHKDDVVSVKTTDHEYGESNKLSNDSIDEAKPSVGACGNTDESKSRDGFVSITQFVTPGTDLQKLVDTHLDLKAESENNDCATNKEDPLLLTGLHTCGNLGPSMLDIFIHGQGKIVGICNVGCCYHHLDEEFIRSPYQSKDCSGPDFYGFPMSDLLRSRSFQLGRNARMLASQTPARMADTGKLSHTSLYYRALLQVILRDLTGTIQQDWQVGKIFAKSKDFPDYVRRALKKLNIAEGDKLTPQVIADYQERYGHYEQKLSAFVQLRAALAPVVEALILLDRLIYLREKDEVDEAHLVKLFDDVKSPRCYSLISTRK